MGAIRTKEYVLDQSFVSQFMKRQSRNRLYIPVGAILVFCLPTVLGDLSPVALAIVLIFGIWWIFRFERDLRTYPSKLAEAGLFSVPRWNEVDDTFYSSYVNDGTFSRNQIERFILQVEKHPQYYVLHLNSRPRGFNFIPADAFESEDDRRRFEEILASRGVKIVHKG